MCSVCLRLPTLFVLVLGLTVGTFALGAERVLRLATTTSTENSGLLRVLLPAFEKDSGYKVHVIAVGTGKALRMGQDGDADALLVHAREDEEKFMAAGYGSVRRDVMYNDFIIVGPKVDPAGVKTAKNAAEALARIGKSASVFISRGDESGTHKKEQALWRTTDVTPSTPWHRAIGQGMEQALQMASETQGYTLTDRGTWLALRRKLDLDVAYQGDAQLFNPYGVIAVNPKHYPDINHDGAVALVNWLTSAKGRQAIASFTQDGDPLFFPTTVQTHKSAP